MPQYDVVMENLTFTYFGDDKPALRDINLTMERGEVVGILGPNNAGKTTLCRCMNGLVPHFFTGTLTGKSLIRDIETTKTEIGKLSQMVGLVFDDPLDQVICSDVASEVAFGPENLGVPPDEIKKRVKESMDAVGLKGFDARDPRELSGGEQQLVAIAANMSMYPDIFVLDEPTSNLDPLGCKQVLSVVADLAKKHGKTLVLVSNEMENYIFLVNRLILMNEGRIVLDGSPEEFLRGMDSLEQLGMSAPQVTRLFWKLHRKLDMSISRVPKNLEEAYSVLQGLVIPATFRFEKKEKALIGEFSENRKPIIELRDVSYTYPGPVQALVNVDLKIYENEYVAIIGQNGSGKSTLVKLFNGLLKPTEGTVTVFDMNTREVPVWKLSQKVGYVFQNPDLQLFNSTVKNEIAFSLKALGFLAQTAQDRVQEMAKKFKVDYALDKSPGSLSKGDRQRVAIASVLAINPEVIVIDEPTTGQDPRMAREVMEISRTLHREGKTIVVITHNMELAAEYSQRTVVMRQGKVILDGSTRDVYADTEKLQGTHLNPPQITLLGQMLKNEGFPPDILNVDEMVEILLENVPPTTLESVLCSC